MVREGGRGAGLVVPGYVIVGELGRGAGTVVYRVRRDDAEWALKVRLGSGPIDNADLGAFRREAALLALADHSTLPRVHEVGLVEGRPYLVMDLIAGRPLTSMLRTGPLPEDEVWQIATAVGEALAAGHRVGLVHRDIKPDNVMVQPDGRARLIDFGLATMTAGHASDTVVGTLAYAAPEQAGMLKRVVDARSDLYSLGVVLFECATGVAPFVSGEVGELLRMHASVPAPDVRTLRPELPAGLATVIATLLAKDPDDRYDSGDALVADLHRLAGEPGAVVTARRSITGRVAYRAALIERDSELNQLVARWRGARSGQGAVALVRGNQGSGKSRLLGELSGRVREEGFPALTLRAGDDVPLAPLRRAVEQYLTQIDQMAPAAGDGARARMLAAAGGAGDHVAALSPALAGLLASAGGADRPDGTDDFIPAIAGFLMAWARGCGGVLVCVDGAERLDGATARILAQLTATAREAPLLIVAGIDGVDGGLGADRLFQTGTVDLTVTLSPFDEVAAARLIAALGGGMTFGTEVAERLSARSGRTPLEITEYLTAVIDAGLLSPNWGRWVLDVAGLDGMALPSDMIGLISRRIDATSQATRDVLEVAAVVGHRFARELVARVAATVGIQDIGASFDEAVGQGILLPEGAGYAFAHDRARAALLDRADPGHGRALHQHVALELDTGDPAERFAVARHYLYGTPERTPGPAVRAYLDAAELALAQHAGEEAVEFLEHAQTLASELRHDSRPDPSRIQRLLVDAYAMAGRLSDAATLLEAILATATDPIERARILARIAWVRKTAWDIKGAFGAAMQGLAAARGAPPSNRLLFALSTIGIYLAGAFVQTTGLGFGGASGARRARFEVMAELSAFAVEAAIRDGQPLLSLALAARQLYPVARLGDSPQYLRYCGGRVIIADVMKFPGRGRWFARAQRAANSIGTPEAHAAVRLTNEQAKSLIGKGDEAVMLRAIADVGHLLPVSEYLDCISIAIFYLVWRGRTREARTWYERAVARLDAADLPGHSMELAGLATAAALGRVSETDIRLRHISAQESLFTQPMVRVNAMAVLAAAACEQHDLGERFTQIAADFAALKIPARILLAPQRLIYTTLAYGMLERCRIVSDDQRPAALTDARDAVAALQRMPAGDVISAHALVTAADLHLVSGDPLAALAGLTIADAHLNEHDVPLAAYEAARVRARANAVLGRIPEATGFARYAMSLAEHHGWPHRSDWIRTEFNVTAPADGSADAERRSTFKPNETSSMSTYGRRLAALEQLSLAASRIVDPRQLTRIALDQTIQILAAERAFLFLTDGGDETRLVSYMGRDTHGNDIETLTEYGSTLVERVRADRQPVVVTGTDEGAALGSQSVVAHGLRSIIVAPLLLDIRLIGVVYLDSRIAKGMFTTADIGTLTAITTHIAAALETARAAQLASAVQSTQQRLAIAETMRAAISDLTATLDPGEVLLRLQAIMRQTLPGDTARLYALDNDQLRQVTATPDPDPARSPVKVSVTAGDTLDRLLRHDIAARDTGLAPLLSLDTPAALLAVPLRTRDTTLGLILLTSDQPNTYSSADTELGTALAAQGMIAYDNARLFAEVRTLAITDGLTGVYNRRHFFNQATTAINDAREHHTALSAVMLDIDHFKRVNDTHGHPVGDQVIQAVATRLTAITRDSDLLARYGGEEFALILHQSADIATQVGERIRAAIAEDPITTDAGPLPVTVSVGVAHYTHHDTNPGTLLSRADTALYQAKQQGRNQVVVHRPDTAA